MQIRTCVLVVVIELICGFLCSTLLHVEALYYNDQIVDWLTIMATHFEILILCSDILCNFLVEYFIKSIALNTRDHRRVNVYEKPSKSEINCVLCFGDSLCYLYLHYMHRNQEITVLD